jgi:hypothetical protein
MNVMKKLFITGLVLLASAAMVKADPPKKIDLTFNAETNKLKVVVFHPVRNVTDHYIDLISISVDSKEVKVIKPEKQSSAENETVEIPLTGIKKGSEISVSARCNKFGTKTSKLTL